MLLIHVGKTSLFNVFFFLVDVDFHYVGRLSICLSMDGNDKAVSYQMAKWQRPLLISLNSLSSREYLPILVPSPSHPSSIATLATLPF